MISIVFSKDRAMQLEAFLRSYERHVALRGPLFVSWRASSARHELAYHDVFAAYPWVTLHDQRQATFKTDLLDLIPRDGNVVFFVDDLFFIRPWSVRELPGLSLRLAPHLTYNYMSGGMLQPCPSFTPYEDLLSWNWGAGKLAWGYPLSIDGHVFDAAEMHEMLGVLQFDSPNTMESQLQAFVSRFSTRPGYCYSESRIVNSPWNLVQTDWHNRNAGGRADDLLAAWEAGRRINVPLLYGVLNESVHQEFPLALEDR